MERKQWQKGGERGGAERNGGQRRGREEIDGRRVEEESLSRTDTIKWWQPQLPIDTRGINNYVAKQCSASDRTRKPRTSLLRLSFVWWPTSKRRSRHRHRAAHGGITNLALAWTNDRVIGIVIFISIIINHAHVIVNFLLLFVVVGSIEHEN